MAFLGAAMWVAFSGTMNKTQTKVDSNVTTIGSDSGTPAAGVGGSAPTGAGTGGTGTPTNR
ncbi:MAG: hypothetical protein NVSMB12_04700 [Acidimicrobiales bacterium]